MTKLLSIVYMFFCLGLALVFDKILELLRKQFVQFFRVAPMAVGGIFLNLIFVAALLLLIWLVLFRLDKSLLVSSVFILTAILPLLFVPVMFANSRILLKGLPDFIALTALNFLNLIFVPNSYFSITGTFILGIGVANLFRRGKTPANG